LSDLGLVSLGALVVPVLLVLSADAPDAGLSAPFADSAPAALPDSGEPPSPALSPASDAFAAGPPLRCAFLP